MCGLGSRSCPHVALSDVWSRFVSHRIYACCLAATAWCWAMTTLKRLWPSRRQPEYAPQINSLIRRLVSGLQLDSTGFWTTYSHRIPHIAQNRTHTWWGWSMSSEWILPRFDVCVYQRLLFLGWLCSGLLKNYRCICVMCGWVCAIMFKLIDRIRDP